MTMYASKTPRDLDRGNTDPKPWVTDAGERLSFVDSMRLDIAVALDGKGSVASYDPRPEFDLVQHNGANPVLVEFRRTPISNRSAGAAREWAEYVTRPAVATAYGWTVAQVAHARKVFLRLAVLRTPNIPGFEGTRDALASLSVSTRRAATHDPRCISLTHSKFNRGCDCETLRLIDAQGSHTSHADRSGS